MIRVRRSRRGARPDRRHDEVVAASGCRTCSSAGTSARRVRPPRPRVATVRDELPRRRHPAGRHRRSTREQTEPLIGVYRDRGHPGRRSTAWAGRGRDEADLRRARRRSPVLSGLRLSWASRPRPGDQDPDADRPDAARPACWSARPSSCCATPCRPGVTTGELDALAEDHIRSHGGVPSFQGYGPAVPGHHLRVGQRGGRARHPRRPVLVDGDVISIDCGAIVEGWHGDAAITVAIGEVADDVLELMRVTEESLWAGIAAARLGGRVSDISHAVESLGPVARRLRHPRGLRRPRHRQRDAPAAQRAQRRPPRRGPGWCRAWRSPSSRWSPWAPGDGGARRRLDRRHRRRVAGGALRAHLHPDDGAWVLTAIDGGAARLAALGVELSSARVGLIRPGPYSGVADLPQHGGRGSGRDPECGGRSCVMTEFAPTTAALTDAHPAGDDHGWRRARRCHQGRSGPLEVNPCQGTGRSASSKRWFPSVIRQPLASMQCSPMSTPVHRRDHDVQVEQTNPRRSGSALRPRSARRRAQIRLRTDLQPPLPQHVQHIAGASAPAREGMAAGEFEMQQGAVPGPARALIPAPLLRPFTQRGRVKAIRTRLHAPILGANVRARRRAPSPAAPAGRRRAPRGRPRARRRRPAPVVEPSSPGRVVAAAAAASSIGEARRRTARRTARVHGQRAAGDRPAVGQAGRPFATSTAWSPACTRRRRRPSRRSRR